MEFIEANRLFEQYLGKTKLPYKSFDDMQGVEGKRPDFVINPDSNPIYVEVKEIELEEWEEKQLIIRKKLAESFNSLKLGCGLSTFADTPSDKEIQFFSVFLKKLEGNNILSSDMPLYIVMPHYQDCVATSDAIIVIYMLDNSKQRKQIIISPETNNKKYPIPLNYMDHRWIHYADINNAVHEYYKVYSDKPVIALMKNSLDFSRILPIVICGSFDKADQVRNKIRKASSNLSAYQDKGPCVLVLYTKSCVGITNHELLNAIAGTEIISIPVSLDGKPLAHNDARLIRDRDGQLAPWKNTRFSAISIMETANSGMRLRTYHNPFAKTPLSRDMFLSDDDKTFFFDDSGKLREHSGTSK